MYTALFLKVSKGKSSISLSNLKKIIINNGIKLYDGRIKSDLEKLKSKIDVDMFSNLVDNNEVLNRLFTDDLVVPEWPEFTAYVEEIYKECLKDHRGDKSTETPVMRRANDDLFGVSICTIDGQRFNLGDTEVDFCAYSCSKVLSYVLAVKEHGSDYVHSFVGKEPCAKTYNSLNLKKIPISESDNKYIPHNPFSDAGAILCSSLVGKDLTDSERFFSITEALRKATNSKKIGFSHESFLSERNNSDRRSCMAFMMRERNTFPWKTDISKVLELYFQLRSIELNSSQMAVLAATLANGGVCPLNGNTVFDINIVRDCLSLMLSCGLYDYSGEWAFTVGLPAKSAISGCIFIVVPNRMGICVYSPRLDINGNSVRAIKFAQLLVQRFSFHHLDNTREHGEDIRVQPCQPSLAEHTIHRSESASSLPMLMSAAEQGDIDSIRGLLMESVDLMQRNYDHRTALHLAASHGYNEVVRLLIRDENGNLRNWKDLSLKDRWGMTPLDAAVIGGHTEIEKYLRRFGARKGNEMNIETDYEDKN